MPTPAEPRTSQFRQTIEQIVRDDKQPDLSLRQIAVLLYVRDEIRDHCTVRGLAAHLNVSKPAITRAADRLHELGLAERQPDKTDKRSVFIRATARGRHFAARLSAPAGGVGA